MKKPRIEEVRPAGADHQVVTLRTGGEKHLYRRTPCDGCPWVRENVGSFPAKAFEHSASTAYDMAQNVFACHESGQDKPSTCAGFLLRGANHNLAFRLAILSGTIKPHLLKEGHRPLFNNYVEMAIANGVSPASPRLKICRD